MRLLYSTGSPFARIVRIALLETGLDARVDKQEITRERLYSIASEVLTCNPVGRVPTLELDDGVVLTESKLILDYIDAVNQGPKLLPRDGSDGWHTLAAMGQVSGLLEGIVTWMRTLRTKDPAGASAVIARESARVNRIADALQIAVGHGAFVGPMNAAQIVLGAALGLVEPRLPVWKWREGRSTLVCWYDAIAARPSFRSTVPPPL
jgi:glutathione S-transferase